MTEEEKKAIEIFKASANYFVTRETTQTILNLVEKQQKEIEELKQPQYSMDLKTNSITILINDCISKDKIREKIEELKNFGKKLDKEEKISAFISNAVSIRYLKDLLQEGE